MGLPGLQDEYEGDVIFIAVVRETGTQGTPATVDYAEWYADDKNFNFPATADVGNNWLPFMGDGYPTNLIIDLRTMEFKYVNAGLMTTTAIRGRLTQYLP